MAVDRLENDSSALVCGDGVDHQLLRDGTHELVRRRQRLGCSGRPLLRLAQDNTVILTENGSNDRKISV